MNSFGKFLYGLYGVLILGSRIFKDMEEYDLKGSAVIRSGPTHPLCRNKIMLSITAVCKGRIFMKTENWSILKNF